MAIKILTKEHVDAFKKFGRQDGDDAKVILKLFLPSHNFYWFITEYDPETGIGFGFANLNDPQCAEMGDIDLYELVNLRRRTPVDRSTPLTEVKVGGPDCPIGVERDIHFKIGSWTIGDVAEAIKSGKRVH